MINQIIKIIQFLSLDVVAGALGVGYLFIRVLNIVPPDMWWVILAISVWIIYSVDHLLDSNINKEKAVNERHSFFYKNRRGIIITVIIVSFINIILYDYRLT